jgi:hydroxymethylbilane synthase
VPTGRLATYLGPPVRIGARTSPLARAQAGAVAALLARDGVPSQFVGITTRGDTDGRQLTEIGGTGVFVSAVRDALVEGRIDVAVHSFKDLPTAAVGQLELAAVPTREDTRDVLVGRRLADLAGGSRIGTGAPRRAVQLAELAARLGIRLEVGPVRGNVDTRLELARRGEWDAVVLAAAGLRRLGRLTGVLAGSDGRDTLVSGLPATVLAEDEMLPAPAQGALALEIHSSLAPAVQEAVRALDDPISRAEALAERGFLAALEAGCTAPVAARARVKSVRGRSLDLTLAAVIGKTYSSNLSGPANSGSDSRDFLLRVQRRGSTEDPREFGMTLADQVLAELRERTRSS